MNGESLEVVVARTGARVEAIAEAMQRDRTRLFESQTRLLQKMDALPCSPRGEQLVRLETLVERAIPEVASAAAEAVLEKIASPPRHVKKKQVGAVVGVSGLVVAACEVVKVLLGMG